MNLTPFNVICKDLMDKYNLKPLIINSTTDLVVNSARINYNIYHKSPAMAIKFTLENQILAFLRLKPNLTHINCKIQECADSAEYEIMVLAYLPKTKIQQRFYGHINN
jgi:hypothetical protein